MASGAALEEVPFLDVADPAFSVRSPAVAEARERSWYARTPYGIAVLRYRELGQLLRDPRLRQGSHSWPALNGVGGSFADWWVRMILNTTGEDHARLRALAAPAFAKERIEALRPVFAGLAAELVDAFAARGTCEFMADFAEPYATRVICGLVGLPEARWRHLADLAADMGLALGVTYANELARIDAATDAMFDFAREAVAAARQGSGRGAPATFLETLAAAAERGEGALSERELLDLVVVSIFGGIDTTRSQLGLALDTFAAHPDQWEALAADPTLAGAAVEEVMRVRPTVTWVTREAVETFDYEGLTIARGTVLHLFSQSACSDPRAFPEAGFDIRARRKVHFGFGAGVHHCIGHWIARADMTEALRLLSARLTGLGHARPPRWLPDSGNTGPIDLPLRFVRR